MSSDSTDPDWIEPVWSASAPLTLREGEQATVAPPAPPGPPAPTEAEPRPEELTGDESGGPSTEDAVEERATAATPDTPATRARRRRWPVVLGVAAAASVVAVVSAEIVGRRAVASQVEQRLRDSGMSGRIEITVGSSPWRPSVLAALAGRGLDELDVRIVDGTVGGLAVTGADYRLSDIEGDVSLGSGAVVVRSIGRGDVRLELPAESLASTVGSELIARDGRLWASGTLPWDRRAVKLRVVDGSLELGGDAAALWGGPVEVPVADGYLLPCPPEATVDGELLVLTCHGNDLPGVLQAPLSIDPSDPSAPTGELTPPQSIVRDGG